MEKVMKNRQFKWLGYKDECKIMSYDGCGSDIEGSYRFNTTMNRFLRV